MIHCSISFFIHLAMIFACLYSCLASGEDVFCISPNGVAAEKMELDICGDMDGDKGFDENLLVECNSDLKTKFPAGTIFKISVKPKKTKNIAAMAFMR